MSNVWLFSDPHFGHRAISKYRPQVSSVEHNSELLTDNILSKVGKRDTLWFLGDVIFDREHMKYTRKIKEHVEQINIVIGNHDTDSAERQKILLELWSEGTYSKVHSLVSYKDCWLSHAPMHPDELRGKFNVHGHCHAECIDDPRYYNVCCDHTDLMPVMFKDIKAELTGRNL